MLAWVGIRGALAYSELRSAETSARAAMDTISDPAQTAPHIAEFASHAASAHDLTSDPVWRLAEAAPWAGPQLRAVSTIAAAADGVAREALVPLSDVVSAFSVDAFRPVDGRIDTAVFREIAGPARTGADAVADAAASVSALDDAPLLGPVREAVEEVATLLDTGASATDALARAAHLLPAMLGADGERSYLIAFQNNAEWRSLGGIVGAMAVVRTADGAIEMTAQGSSSDFSRFDESVLPLEPELDRLFEARPGRFVQNVTQIPDFTIGGPLAREMWQRQTGQQVDGVIATDPVALSYILAATGPVDLPTGDVLTSDNAVSLLLNDVYLRYEQPRDQDAFFAAAAAAVFDRLATGAADPAALITALGKAGDERRLLLWSADADDQAVLAGTTLAGELPVSTADDAAFGVYLNDGTGSKMDYYVTADTSLTWESCTLDARGRNAAPITLQVTVTNTAPADAATSLPTYITGGGGFGVPAGISRTVAYLYLPTDAALTSAVRSDRAGFGGGTHDGRQVLAFGSDLAPGESITATVTVIPPGEGASSATASVTPTIDANRPTSVVATCGAP
ncbi:DUF4012 domain-containing protein [Microbacterium radiodurans]|uniref:DUF4012 domain-containing protein n=2 Tax=Microbacterium radiodurans TaxID=661398 RepID=A0A5J5IZ02_9MICO|nr:DUF4012 domain-containing protein [Microbacterium radiodurans]